MTDDIVTRLRKSNFDCLHGKEVDVFHLTKDAADEIERLQEWKELAYEMRNRYWWCMRAKILRKFDAMHKADWKRGA